MITRGASNNTLDLVLTNKHELFDVITILEGSEQYKQFMVSDQSIVAFRLNITPLALKKILGERNEYIRPRAIP